MHKAKQKAFNLAELLVCLTILAIAVALALPLLQSLIQSNRSQLVHDRLKTSLHLARTHSITQGQGVDVCGSSGESCDHAWEHGWVVKERYSENSLETMRLPQQMRLSWNRPSQPIIRFTTEGHSSSSNGSFTLCNQDAKPLWKIVLNRQGRARTAAPSELSEGDC